MKRYRVLDFDFDARAGYLSMEIKDTLRPEVQARHRSNQEELRRELLAEFGTKDGERKLKDFMALGKAPMSILAFHNRFLWQVRTAFVMGAYYPALTGACALGERVLNHLVIGLRDHYVSTPEYKRVYSKDSFDDWDTAIDTLQSWGVLLPDVAQDYLVLRNIRHASIHFRPELDQDDRSRALEAVRTLSAIIDGQFSAYGTQPWFMKADTAGASFLRKGAEEEPFVKEIYIPKCRLVGPHHRVEVRDGRWCVVDDREYEDTEITDEEFAALFRARGG